MSAKLKNKSEEVFNYEEWKLYDLQDGKKRPRR